MKQGTKSWSLTSFEVPFGSLLFRLLILEDHRASPKWCSNVKEEWQWPINMQFQKQDCMVDVEKVVCLPQAPHARLDLRRRAYLRPSPFHEDRDKRRNAKVNFLLNVLAC